MTDITLYTAADGSRTYRKMGEAKARLCVVCPAGDLGDVCGQVLVEAPGDTASIVAAVAACNATVKAIQTDGCKVHGTTPGVVPGESLDAVITSTPPEVIAEALRAVFAADAAPKPVPSAPVEPVEPVPYEGGVHDPNPPAEDPEEPVDPEAPVEGGEGVE